MNIPYHDNLCRANTKSYWVPHDSEERWQSNMQNTHYAKLLTKLGFNDPTAITYAYNSHGYRDVEFDQRDCAIAFGCSFTHGTGICQEQTWPSVLSSLLGLHVWNLGVGGASLDTVFRLGQHYIPMLNPKFVAVLTPPNTRFEYHNKDNFIVTSVNTFNETSSKHFFKDWFGNQINLDIHQSKTLYALKTICNSFNIPFVHVCPLNDWHEKINRARDLVHPDAESNRQLAKRFADLLK